jgi:hypothetical protein
MAAVDPGGGLAMVTVGLVMGCVRKTEKGEYGLCVALVQNRAIAPVRKAL